MARERGFLSRAARPVLVDGLVRIPIHFDDYALYAQGQAYAAWEEGALARIEGQPFTCFSLHDCYAQFWLPHYTECSWLGYEALGQLTTLGELAEDVRRSTAHVAAAEGHGGGTG